MQEINCNTVDSHVVILIPTHLCALFIEGLRPVCRGLILPALIVKTEKL